jgi:hypothetical protein
MLEALSAYLVDLVRAEGAKRKHLADIFIMRLIGMEICSALRRNVKRSGHPKWLRGRTSLGLDWDLLEN